MLNVGAPELLLIIFVGLLVLGPSKLPDVAHQAGRALAELRRLSSGFQSEINHAMQAPPGPRPKAEVRRPPRREPLRAAPDDPGVE